MEPEVKICCGRKDKKNSCFDIVIVILGLLFAFVLGVIIGSVTGLVEAIGIVYFYALITVFGVLAVLAIIYRFCIGRYRK